jgi:hypothetical protein
LVRLLLKVGACVAMSGAVLPMVASAGEQTDRAETQPKVVVPPSQYYPLLSKRLNETGRVVLRYSLGPNARPHDIVVLLSDSPRLEAAAVRLLEDALIETPAEAHPENGTKSWELAVLFELDSCQKLTSPNPNATVVRLCAKRSVVVGQSAETVNPFQPPKDADVREAARQAERGDVNARRWLCSLYVYWKVSADEHPERWCELAVRDGNPYSAAMLADLYYAGRGVSLDYARAFQLYKGAAVRGMGFAQMMLGAMYVLGRGVEPDREAGLVWLERSMEDRHPPEDNGAMIGP